MDNRHLDVSKQACDWDSGLIFQYKNCNTAELQRHFYDYVK